MVFSNHSRTNRIAWSTTEVYAHSVDEEILGSISGYKVADITDDFEIVKTRA